MVPSTLRNWLFLAIVASSKEYQKTTYSPENYLKNEIDNRSKQLNPNNDAYWKSKQ